MLKDSITTTEINGGDIFNINLGEGEKVCVYPKNSQGIIMLDRDVLCQRFHQQIIFHEMSNDSLLCEIKPFVDVGERNTFSISNTVVSLIAFNKNAYINHNNIIIGCIPCGVNEFKFKKYVKNEKEYGILINEQDKWIILFDKNRLIYNDSFIDYELKESHIQIYSHNSNVFNIGGLIKFEFATENLETKCVKDRGEEHAALSEEFGIIYFLDAIKCGRFKYAYNHLSYRLKSSISIEVLNQYFAPFNRFIYISKENAYVTLKNNKVAGIYHFVIKDDLIDNIY